ncbi:acyltransferase family protein [Micromonospora narathiwatensis]|uniref:Peptidoglycan/LPS O-acetylase OafA/YrhL, contains acyltransferase and SGNH-hydrolase domains n=1 Tax=Micromonospora narathiwatensis TaxID=299146 RepID=A0A1A8ZS52_9ACTN|nr:acyltransferase [Micromonospora narathiwatensis]SBT46712.1 Peptidoglycan/LPS O-acetylase OafA/YrhL, contains acyltransferase and SGNH-hydrolase domains [Micromonospora narathiwatensis]
MTITQPGARPESPPGLGERSRLPSLTGLRALAGLSVFITHGIALGLFTDPNVILNYIHYGANAGMFGLGFFFVLTGFVVTWTASSKDSARQFWRRRFFKLFPNHVVVYAIILALWIPTGVPIKALEALAGLFLVTSWFPSESFLFNNLNGPMWSANIDVLAYAAFPLLYFLVKKIAPSRLWAWAIGVTALSALVPVIANAFLPDHPPSMVAPEVSWPRHWFGFYFPLTRALEFVVGILMARIVLTGRWIGLRALPASLLAVGTYLVTLDVPIFYGYTFVPLIPMALLIPAFATADVRGQRTLVNSRLMVWLGERMYAFFVIHVTVLFMVHAAFSGENGVVGMYDRVTFDLGTGILVLIATYLVCLVLASILYAVVEQPIMRRWARPRRRGEPNGGVVGPLPGTAGGRTT